MNLLIDADVVLFQSAAVATQDWEWEPGMWTTHMVMGLAQDRVETKIESLANNFEISTGSRPEKMFMLMGGDTNFRHDIFPTYKGNRGRKPPGYQALKDWMKEEYECREVPGTEADDLAGIAMTHPTLLGKQCAVATIDKDWKQIPGLHLDWKHAETELVTPEDAERLFYIQALTGDAVDNIPGLKGYGPATALKWLNKHGWNWDSVMAAYDKAGFDEEYALTQARLVKILHASDYDLKKKEVILWTP